MRMTNDHRNDPSAQLGDDPVAIPDLHLRLTATVTIIDTTGTRVSADSVTTALRLIRAHHMGALPLLSLADSHRTSALFTRDHWLVMPTKLIVLAKDLGRAPDYKLLYHSWHIAEHGADTRLPVKLSALRRIAHAAAEASGQPVTITSPLLGFAETRVVPGEITAEDADDAGESSPPEATPSVLDTLDDDLFDITPTPSSTPEDRDHSASDTDEAASQSHDELTDGPHTGDTPSGATEPTAATSTDQAADLGDLNISETAATVTGRVPGQLLYTVLRPVIFIPTLGVLIALFIVLFFLFHAPTEPAQPDVAPPTHPEPTTGLDPHHDAPR